MKKKIYTWATVLNSALTIWLISVLHCALYILFALKLPLLFKILYLVRYLKLLFLRDETFIGHLCCGNDSQISEVYKNKQYFPIKLHVSCQSALSWLQAAHLLCLLLMDPRWRSNHIPLSWSIHSPPQSTNTPLPSLQLGFHLISQ